MKIAATLCPLVLLLSPACLNPRIHEVDSLEVGNLAEDEGLFVVRFFTAFAKEDEVDQPDTTPDLDYSVHLSVSKSTFMPPPLAIHVHAADGPGLVVRRIAAGDYYFNEIVMDHPGGLGGGPGSYLQFPLEASFRVLPGQVTYLGDVHVRVVEEPGLLGLGGVFRCGVAVASRPDEVREALARRYAGDATSLIEASMSLH